MKTKYEAPSSKVIKLRPARCFALSDSLALPGQWQGMFMDEDSDFEQLFL